MTTIAYKDGVIAADSLVASDNLIVGEVRKIVRVANLLAGASGLASATSAFLDWVENGYLDDDDIPEWPESFEGFIAHPDGTIEVFDSFGSHEIKTAIYASGSGDSVALGAMDAGASAIEAVEIACRRTLGSTPPIQVLYRDPQCAPSSCPTPASPSAPRKTGTKPPSDRARSSTSSPRTG